MKDKIVRIISITGILIISISILSSCGCWMGAKGESKRGSEVSPTADRNTKLLQLSNSAVGEKEHLDSR